MKDETVTSTVSVEVIVVTKYGQHQYSIYRAKLLFKPEVTERVVDDCTVVVSDSVD